MSDPTLDAYGVTDREVEVLTAYCREQGAKEAADQLGMSPATVHRHLEHIRSKLGVSTTAAAVYILRDRLA